MSGGAAGDAAGLRQVPQVDAFVLETAWIDDGAGLDQRHGAAQILPAVQGDDGIDPAVIQVEREAVPPLETPAHHRPFRGAMESGVLQVHVVLIRPEPRHLVVPTSVADHAARRRGALPHRVLPVFDTHPPPEYRMEVVRDVACREDAGDAGPAVLVHDDAIVQLDAAFRQAADGRLDADGSDDEIAVDAAPAARDDSLDTAISL